MGDDSPQIQAPVEETLAEENPQDSFLAEIQDPEKRDFLQKQLAFLLNAEKCRQLENKFICNHPQCVEMKDVLKHMPECQLVDTCNYCLSSRKVLTHWDSCQDSKCVMCSPLKAIQSALKKSGRKEIKVRPLYEDEDDYETEYDEEEEEEEEEDSEEEEEAEEEETAPEEPDQPTEPEQIWRPSFPKSIRMKVTYELVKAKFPVPDENNADVKIATYIARLFEKYMFHKCTSAAQYLTQMTLILASTEDEDEE